MQALFQLHPLDFQVHRLNLRVGGSGAGMRGESGADSADISLSSRESPGQEASSPGGLASCCKEAAIEANNLRLASNFFLSQTVIFCAFVCFFFLFLPIFFKTAKQKY